MEYPTEIPRDEVQAEGRDLPETLAIDYIIEWDWGTAHGYCNIPGSAYDWEVRLDHGTPRAIRKTRPNASSDHAEVVWERADALASEVVDDWRALAADMIDRGIAEQQARAAALVASGATYETAADELGVSDRSTVGGYISDYRDRRADAVWLAKHAPDL